MYIDSCVSLVLQTCRSFRRRVNSFAFPFDNSHSINQLTILFSHFSCNPIHTTTPSPAFPQQLGCCARRLTTTQLPGRTGRPAVSLGGWLHHVRLASHRARLPLVRLHCAEFPSFPQVSVTSSEPKTANALPCPLSLFSGDTATCLHNAPHEDSALGRSLPGTLLSLDAQCRRDRGTYACFKDERVCAQLFCFDAQTGYCVAYRPAAEGSACGNGYVRKTSPTSVKQLNLIFSLLHLSPSPLQHCLDGRCTPLPSNIIPDYGNHYRLVYK